MADPLSRSFFEQSDVEASRDNQLSRLASAWLRSDRSRHHRTPFLHKLLDWLATHPTLTPAQAVHVLNHMLATGQYQDFVQYLQIQRSVRDLIDRPCDDVALGKQHKPHQYLWTEVAHSCPGLSRPTTVTPAKVSYWFVAFAASHVHHVVESAAVHWSPLADSWGFHDPRLKLALGCRGEWADKVHPVYKLHGGERWCRSCAAWVESHRWLFPHLLQLPWTNRVPCTARALSRLADRDVRCERMDGHKGKHFDPDLQQSWSGTAFIRYQ